MNTKAFDEAMGEIDAGYVEKAMDYQPKAKKRGWARWAASAACLALVVIAAVTIADWQWNRIELSDASVNVTARYTNKAPLWRTSDQLVFRTEEELFTVYNTAIFRGTVLEISNIELNFNGSKAYRAIAEIEVEKVYRGPCAVGEVVSVLLPCPIEKGIWVEDTGVVSNMRAGAAGIFMPMVYNENSVWEQNGARLILADITEYGFADGVRYAFLEVDGGLLFDRHTYQSISGARTLDEIEEYIGAMLERLPAPDEYE